MSLHKINGENFLKCLKCDFVCSAGDSSLTSSETIKNNKVGTGVQDDKNILATYFNKCKKCGYDKAQVLDMGIFYSDEDNLILLKCGSCGFSERIGRKTG